MRNNAGYEIIMAIEFPHNIEVVLGKGKHDYVTWLCRNKTDYFWGHYIRNEIDARIDLYERVMKKAQAHIDLYESKRNPWFEEAEKE